MPREALREALLNACINKDYASNTPIQIRVYENKLEIINTFLAVLELVKKQVTEVMQEEGFGEVYLTHRPDTDKFNFEEDAFTDADGYN